MEFESSGKGFLGIANPKLKDTQAIIIPFGLEHSVTYGKGTSKGPKTIIAASHGSPLLVGIKKNENFISSDIQAIAAKTKKYISLNDSEIAVLTSSLTSGSFASVSTLSVITPIFTPLISPVSSDP